MAYIGRPLQGANLAVMSAVGNGSSTTPIATLDYATTTNGIAVYLDGVRQLPSVDYNVTSQTTLTFTTAPANGVGIDVYFLGLELSIPTPADATVAKAKITSTLIHEHIDTTISASDSILFADATDSNANKKDTVQGILDLASGGAWTLIATAVGSSSSSLTITGINSTYDIYAIALSDITRSGDEGELFLRLGDSSGIDSGGSDYSYSFLEHTADNSQAYRKSTGASQILIAYNSGSATGEGLGGLFYLHGPSDSSSYPKISGKIIVQSGDNHCDGLEIVGMRNAVIAVDRVQIIPDGGTISGRVTVWGIAHA